MSDRNISFDLNVGIVRTDLNIEIKVFYVQTQAPTWLNKWGLKSITIPTPMINAWDNGFSLGGIDGFSALGQSGTPVFPTVRTKPFLA
jgi:hypothetical protein